ncbi:MAG: hypothetical protein KIT17_04405 [Rubrivivax sp.]|nr:hypothetical protein [Rubrivivax sp.]
MPEEERPEAAPWPELSRVRRAVAVVDVVESVRLMLQHENSVIERWRRFVREVRDEVLPATGGRLVKSLGDGLLIELPNVRSAVQAALEMHHRIAAYNAGVVSGAALSLRAGVHESEIVVDELDVYGAGVNLAARLAALAGPGETVVSPEARDALVDGLDVEIEDLGECFMKNVNHAQRAFRVGPAGRAPLVWSPASAGGDERPSIAVLPFSGGDDAGQAVLGDVLADDLTTRLARHKPLLVISRLSTAAFAARRVDLPAVCELLRCRYVVHGSCVGTGSDSFRVRVQLLDGRSQEVLWADAMAGRIGPVLRGEDELVGALAEQVFQALVAGEVRRATTMPLPTLESYTILLGAVALMHRLSRADFERARDMLAYLIERHPRATGPRAWLGKWHVLRVAQGWSPDPAADASAAHGVVQRALELEPTHGLALAIDGLVCAYINKDLERAGQRYDAAIAANPSESLAWVFRSGLHTYRSEGEQAVACAERAQQLSPLDPFRYYYDNFSSMAALLVGDHASAITFGERSLRTNRTHGSTMRILAIAQVLGGRLDDARRTIAELRALEPGLTVSRFRERYPGNREPHAQVWADALREAGLPV